MYKKAIVKLPCKAMIGGLRSIDLGLPDYDKALRQHQVYIEALESCGLEVLVLAADERFPDSTFVEDVALCTPFGGIITRPAHPSRQTEMEWIQSVIQQVYSTLNPILPPATLEGEDILFIHQRVYIGLSKRTNFAGAQQLTSILKQHGYIGITVPVTECLHLKTGISYLNNNHLLVSGEFIGHPAFSSFNQIIVAEEESYAANCLYINGKVIMPKGFPKTKVQIERLGYPIITIDVSEFQKIDGGLSCLSLRY